MNNPPNREETIVDEALDLPPKQRAAYLNQACGDDARLRNLVEGMLRACQRASAPHEASTLAAPAQKALPMGPSEKPGDRIGRYKLLQQIGEGGCGVVYVADQEEPVKRHVALKVIKLGMDTKQVIARFEAERQALALMDHPNIAKVHDAGATDTGRPYFVMELVRGIKITDYCDKNNLPTEQRLELFIQVCQAIQHAHQKGIIHRDIKPSNILVTLHDGKPVPKVIDFGIAKATAQRLTDKTIFTELDQFIGTPAYMSPEQAEMSALDIDTRSDIYSLGVLLYELLTSKVPFEAKELAVAGLDEMRRIIREKDPVKPSTRLSGLTADEQTTVARLRQAEAPKLIHLVRGDLDWIVMKCLEKDRTRRYETANGLANEIQRFLNDEPVTASPPSQLYRFQKLVRRNKLAFAATAAVAAALILGLGLSTWMYFGERQALQKTAAAERLSRAKEQETEADMRFLQENVLAAARPEGDEGGLGINVTVRRALDAAEPQISVVFSNQPLAEARIRATLGNTYMLLTEWSNAVRHYERALTLSEPVLGKESRATLNYTASLASSYMAVGRHSEGLPLCEQVVKRMKVVLGRNDDDTLGAMDNLGNAYLDVYRVKDALPILRDVADIRRARNGMQHPQTLSSMDNLASALQQAGELNEAIAVGEQTLTNRFAAFGRYHTTTIITMQNLGDSYRLAGRHDEAIKLHKEALKASTVRFGTNHETTIKILNNLGEDYLDSYRAAEAVPWLERAVALHTAAFSQSNPVTLLMMNNLAVAYREIGRRDQAQELLERVMRLHQQRGDPEESGGFDNLGDLYRELGRTSEALQMLERAERLAVEQLGLQHPDTQRTMGHRAAALRQAGSLDAAISLAAKTLELARTNTGPSNPDTLDAMTGLGLAYLAGSRHEDAGKLFDEVVSARRKRPQSESPILARTLGYSAKCLLGQGQFARAEEAAKDGLGLREKDGRQDWELFALRSLLGETLLRQKKYEQAESMLTSGYDGLAKQVGELPFEAKSALKEAVSRLVQFYEATSRPGQAADWMKKLAEFPK